MRKVREISSIFWVLLLAFAFCAVHASAEKTYPSTFNPGAEYSYKYKLNDKIGVFQPKG